MRTLLAAAVTVLAAGTGCFHTPAGPTRAHLDWVPQSASLVVAVDVDQLRRTRWWETIAEPIISALIVEPRERKKMIAQCGIDPLRDLHWLMVVLDATGQVGRGAVIVNGAWTQSKLEACSRARGDIPEPKPDGLVRYAHDAYIGWVAPDTFAITLDEPARPFVREIVEHTTHVAANPVVARQLAHVDPQAAVWAAGGLGQARSPLREVGLDAGKPAIGLHASITLDDALAGELVVELTSPADAAAVAAAWTQSFTTVKRAVPLAAPVAFASRAVFATASLHLDGAGLDNIARFVAKEVGTAHSYDEQAPPVSVDPPQ